MCNPEVRDGGRTPEQTHPLQCTRSWNMFQDVAGTEADGSNI